MPDQVKYNQKLKDKKILIVGGSSGTFIPVQSTTLHLI